MAFPWKSLMDTREQDREIRKFLDSVSGTVTTAQQSITTIQQLIASFFPDCPDDGQLYVRRHGEWVLFEDAEEEVDD